MKRTMLLGATAALLVLGTVVAGAGQSGSDRQPQADRAVEAVAVIFPTEGNDVRGVVHFKQERGTIKVVAEISGLAPGSVHGFHIHQFGNMIPKDGTGMGGHFNPAGHEHALPDKEDRHAGDLGNITADSNGVARLERIFGEFSIVVAHNNVLGRGVVVHAMPDDGSQPTGNAGARIGYGVIGVSKSE